MIKRCDKRGQGLSVNAIILIVLGIFVLAILVVGFTIGWNKVLPFLSSENVDRVVNSCETACTTQSVFGYCSKLQQLSDGENEYEDTCQNYSKKVDMYGIYGVKSCDGLCPSIQTPAQ